MEIGGTKKMEYLLVEGTRRNVIQEKE
jgi:hypothetical protein